MTYKSSGLAMAGWEVRASVSDNRFRIAVGCGDNLSLGTVSIAGRDISIAFDACPGSKEGITVVYSPLCK